MNIFRYIYISASTENQTRSCAGGPRIVGLGYISYGNIWRLPNVPPCTHGAHLLDSTFTISRHQTNRQRLRALADIFDELLIFHYQRGSQLELAMLLQIMRFHAGKRLFRTCGFTFPESHDFYAVPW